MSYEDKREAYLDHLLLLVVDLEKARKEIQAQLGVEARVGQLAKLSVATEKVGTQLRQWDKFADKKADSRSDHDKLEDLRVWIGTLPYAYRKSFYERCSVDELTQSKGVALTVG